MICNCLVIKVRTNFVLWSSYMYQSYSYTEFHKDMLRMWEETSPYHNIEYDIDEEIEMEVCLKQD